MGLHPGRAVNHRQWRGLVYKRNRKCLLPSNCPRGLRRCVGWTFIQTFVLSCDTLVKILVSALHHMREHVEKH